MGAEMKEVFLEFLEKYLFMSFAHFEFKCGSGIGLFYSEVWARAEGIHTI